MLKDAMGGYKAQTENTVNIPKPATPAEARAALLAADPLAELVKKLLVGMRALEAEEGWLYQCSCAASLYDEGNMEAAASNALKAVEDCPPGKALYFSVIEGFAQCLDICIDDARFHAEEAMCDITGDPLTGELPPQLSEGIRLSLAQRDVVTSFDVISTIASALGGKPAEVAKEVIAMTDFVENAGPSQLASDVGRLCALCNVAEDCIAEEAGRLADEVREIERLLSELGSDGLVSSLRVFDAQRRDVHAVQDEEGE